MKDMADIALLDRNPAAVDVSYSSVFVAGPFFKAIDPATGRLPVKDQDRIEGLIAHFENKGCKVFNAHKREAWGQAFLEPQVYTRLDFDEIAEADVLVAMPGSPASAGTHVELGWASSMGKPIVLLLERGHEYAGLVTGLGSVCALDCVEMVDGAVPLAELDAAIARAIAAAHTR
jgi:nucleoside 2-deoxyribosyltransferase